jgi:hypothetical protein
VPDVLGLERADPDQDDAEVAVVELVVVVGVEPQCARAGDEGGVELAVERHRDPGDAPRHRAGAIPVSPGRQVVATAHDSL